MCSAKFNIRVVSTKLYPTTNPTFMNREEEIKEMTRICVQNMKNAQGISSDQSQNKMVLLTSAQMWGSGKSWLGNYFLLELQKTKYNQWLSMSFKGEDIQPILDAKYLLIDLRENGPGQLLSSESMDIGLRKALLAELLHAFPQENPSEWVDEIVDEWPLSDLVKYFKDKYQKMLFIHFDETDLIREFPPKIPVTSDSAAVARYYDFWGLIDPITRSTGCTCYCSGRSPILYLLGKSLFKSFKSPSASLCLLLDTLKVEHIETYLQVLFTFDEGI